MARKTLEEKRIADTRYLFRFEKVVAPTLPNVQTNINSLVVSDLIKTILITTIILFSQMILFTTLRNHLIRIPGISY